MTRKFISPLLVILSIFGSPCQSNTQVIDDDPDISAGSDVEKIYLRSDREFYLAGEIVWYKLQVVCADFTPAANRRLAMVELWNEEKAVLQQQIEVDQGSGDGSLYLPLYLSSGKYVLRAYTISNREKPSQHFEKTLKIVNTFNQQQVPRPVSKSYHAQLMPEGGSLVKGLPARLGVKVTDGQGAPLSYAAHLIKLPSDTILSLNEHKFGLASFTFTPDTSTGYRFIINTADTTLSLNLPAISEEGVVLKVSNHPNQYRAHLYRSPKSGISGGMLLVHSGASLVQQRPFSYKNDSLSVSIPRDSLAEGISRITVFDDNKKVLAERLVFEQPKLMLQPSLHSSKKNYGLREEVKLALTANPESDLSLAVYRLDSLNNASTETILSYLWLSSELRGKIDSASYYFGPLSNSRQLAIDNLLLTHGWRSFKDNKNTNPGRLSDSNWDGHQIRVKVSRNSAGEPVSGQMFYLTIPGKDFRFYSSTSNEQGVVNFYSDRLYGQQEILITPAVAAGNDLHYQMLTSFASVRPRLKSENLYISSRYRHSLEKLSLNMQVQNVYSKDKVNATSQAPGRGLPFYGQSDFSYLLDAYTRFPTMEEVLREYVKEVQVRKKGDDYRLRMYYDVSGRFFDNEPLRLIDGIPVYNSNKIIDYDPLKIEKLAIVDNRFVLGDAFCDGVVSLTTYKGDANPEELNPDAFIISYQALEEKRIFYSPQYAQPDTAKNTPDFRTLLYWNPAVELSQNGKAQLKFFTGDRPGTYFIRVEGIDPEGMAGYRDLQFTVTDSNLP